MVEVVSHGPGSPRSKSPKSKVGEVPDASKRKPPVSQLSTLNSQTSRSALAALGFLTGGRRFLGVTADIIDDRIDVVTRGTMGLTVQCARCHDHKYDPIPTADYYSLYGVFQAGADELVQIEFPETSDAFAAYEKELKTRLDKLNITMAQRRAETAARISSRVTDYLLAQFELHKYPEEGFDQILTDNDLIPGTVRRWRPLPVTVTSSRSSDNQPADCAVGRTSSPTNSASRRPEEYNNSNIA